MACDVKTWWRKWRFGFALSGILIASEIIGLSIILSSTPTGTRWLGDLVFNAADYPVYLSYLAQSQTAWTVRLLYNDLGPIARFEPFWSTIGQLTRLGLSPIVIHEGMRWLMTLALGLTIAAVTRDLYTDRRRSELAALIMIGGLGTGWVFALASNLAQRSIMVPVPPDISTQFSLIPVLFGGAHMILSLALQFLIARWTWLLLGKGERRFLWPDLIAIFLLSAFHPYYIPLIGLMALISLGAGQQSSLQLRSWSWFVGICLALFPSTLYNYWLTRQDAALDQLYFHTNALPLSGWPYWFMSLGAILIAIAFLALRRVPRGFYWDDRPTWAWVWLGSALVCMILPFPWTAKYTQGLLPILALLTIPFWLWIWDSLTRSHPKHKLALGLGGALVLSAPLLYYWSTSSLLAQSEVRSLFYQPSAVFGAWAYIGQDSPPNASVISDEMNVNLWTPAYALRTVWVGHGHGTPDYLERTKAWNAWLKTEDAFVYNRFLDEHDISYILETHASTSDQAAKLLSDDWSQAFRQDDVILWKRTR